MMMMMITIFHQHLITHWTSECFVLFCFSFRIFFLMKFLFVFLLESDTFQIFTQTYSRFNKRPVFFHKKWEQKKKPQPQKRGNGFWKFFERKKILIKIWNQFFWTKKNQNSNYGHHVKKNFCYNYLVIDDNDFCCTNKQINIDHR